MATLIFKQKEALNTDHWRISPRVIYSNQQGSEFYILRGIEYKGAATSNATIREISKNTSVCCIIVPANRSSTKIWNEKMGYHYLFSTLNL